ncbi:MAG: DUF2989 domain-containing protein [Psychrobium sp.]|nr:DUF2989 domain-containing protein [Psychrobium sp.]
MKTTNITFTVALCAGLLSGCGLGEDTIYTICEENPAICVDIKAQGWCKLERALLIRNRLQQLKEPDDERNLYDSLHQWQYFSQCIESASNIVRKNKEDRDPTKTKTFLTSIKEIDKLERLTKNSALPELLYYHWARDGEQNKIYKLVALDKAGKLDRTNMQLKMAMYYAKNDPEKAIKAQYKALRYLTKHDLETLSGDVFANLSTHFYQKGYYRYSYIWAQVAVKFGLKESIYSGLSNELSQRNINKTLLNDIADNTYDSIQDLAFVVPKLKK